MFVDRDYRGGVREMSEDNSGGPVAFWNGSERTLKAKAISKWNHLFPNLQQSALEYYAAVEEAIARHNIPGLETTRVTWKEAGLLSARREYLRLTRGRYVYDLCAAPFGTGYFFSGWMVVNPPALGPFHFLGMGATLACLWMMFKIGFLAVFIFVLACWLLLWLLRTDRLRDIIRDTVEIEDFLLGMTFVGAIYDQFHRPLTYFEQDTAAMFERAVHNAMMETIDGITQAKALRPLTEDERKPIMSDFFKL